VQANAWAAQFLVDQTRTSTQAFTSLAAEAKSLIYNHKLVHDGWAPGGYASSDMWYVFGPKGAPITH
jgi:hypothetical protein